MDTELQTRLQQLEAKIDAILLSVEKTRKYFQVTLWVTVILFVAPLIAMVFAIPAFLSSYLGGIQDEGDINIDASMEQIKQLQEFKDLLN